MIKPFYDRVVEAVRQVDPGHIIFLDGNRYATDFGAFEGPVYPNTVYELAESFRLENCVIRQRLADTLLASAR